MRTSLLILALLVPGCGYQTGNMMPGGVRDVAVELFENETRPETRYRAAEVEFTRQLTRELVRRAHVRLCKPGQAQAIIRGTILQLDRVTLVEDENDRIVEEGLLATVRVEMVDASTGQALLPPFLVTRRAEHIIPRPETLAQSLAEVMEKTAQEAVIRIQAHEFMQSRNTPQR